MHLPDRCSEVIILDYRFRLGESTSTHVFKDVDISAPLDCIFVFMQPHTSGSFGLLFVSETETSRLELWHGELCSS